MSALACGIAGLTIWMLYKARLDQFSQNLLSVAQNKAALLDYITHIHLDEHHPSTHQHDSTKTKSSTEHVFTDSERETILNHFANSIAESGTFRSTGEYVLGYYQGDKLYIYHSLQDDPDDPVVLDRNAPLAEPMQEALTGKSGTIVAVDYRGEKVLAALVPLPQLDAAMVFKIDMAEFDAPYRSAVITSLVAVAFLVLICALLCWREGKRIIEKLAYSESRYRTLMDNVPVCVFLKDGHGNYLTANRYFYMRYGVDKLSIPELSDRGIFPPDIARKHIEDDQRVLKNGVTITGYEKQDLDGEERIIRYLKCPLKGENGDPIGIIGIHQDVTQERRNAEALQKLNAELESQVRRRTAQLELANRELESFAYTVSHDLRAPLRAMAGFSQALKDDYGESLDATATDYINRIFRATGSMAELIDSLLSLSRSTTGQLKIANLDLSQMANDVIEDLRRSDPNHPVEVTIQPGLQAEGDSRLIRNVLENLLGNAWKYSAKTPEPRVEFGQCVTRSPEDEQSEVEAFFVRDNGTGFDMAYANKLFRPFQRMHSEKEYQGSGIGLATVERIVHRHNGRIWAESEPGLGSTFYFTLDQLVH
ncbi:ATP-binding protein [Ruficoccus sp. ZRK36]|uniref:sensor histidine kinase n=1 Tax=Ruficoccus sp. ZRK36 TaxID=2866311 RepID=UPI001C734010|nr:ATP-binding protein [Ruficoccus sp. ZRK36]QYY36539.1 PAS domain-containing protein [Ruficoccus sp. ZRK36]